MWITAWYAHQTLNNFFQRHDSKGATMHLGEESWRMELWIGYQRISYTGQAWVCLRVTLLEFIGSAWLTVLSWYKRQEQWLSLRVPGTRWKTFFFGIIRVLSPKCIVNSDYGWTSGLEHVEKPAQFLFWGIRMLTTIQSLVSLVLVILESLWKTTKYLFVDEIQPNKEPLIWQAGMILFLGTREYFIWDQLLCTVKSAEISVIRFSFGDLSAIS